MSTTVTSTLERAIDTLNFSYSKSAKRGGKEIFFGWALGFLLFGGMAAWVILSGDDPLMGKVIFVLLVPFTIGMLWSSSRLSKTESKWVITLENGVLSWNAPITSGLLSEETFSEPLTNIEKVVSRRSLTSGSETPAAHDYDHAIILKSGKRIELGTTSRIPVEKLIAVMVKKGVVHEQIEH